MREWVRGFEGIREDSGPRHKTSEGITPRVFEMGLAGVGVEKVAQDSFPDDPNRTPAFP